MRPLIFLQFLCLPVLAVVLWHGIVPTTPAAAQCDPEQPPPPIEIRTAYAELIVLAEAVDVGGRDNSSGILRVERVLKGDEDLPPIIGVSGFGLKENCLSPLANEMRGIFFLRGTVDRGLRASYVGVSDAILPENDENLALVVIAVDAQVNDPPPPTLTPSPAVPPTTVAEDAIPSGGTTEEQQPTAVPTLPDVSQYGIERDSSPSPVVAVLGVMGVLMAIVVWGRLWFSNEKGF